MYLCLNDVQNGSKRFFMDHFRIVSQTGNDCRFDKVTFAFNNLNQNIQIA